MTIPHPLQHTPYTLPSKIKLQCKLDQSRRLSRQNLVEGWRTDVAIGQAEIGVIEDVEELRPELEFL